MDPDGAAAFGYVLGRYRFVVLRLHFWLRVSPGCWGVVSVAMQHEKRNTTRASASISQAGDRTVEHVRIAPSSGRPVGALYDQRRGKSARFNDRGVFMDEAISVELQWEGGAEWCLNLSRSLVLIHLQAME